MGVSTEDFRRVSDFIKSETGNVLDTGKEYLVETRLLPLLEREGIKNIQEMVSLLQQISGKGLKEKVIDSLTTHETSFFRDLAPFDALKNTILPELIEHRKDRRELNIWCGAASSGQEPYSIAMLIRDSFPAISNWNIRILATDISRPVLERAKSGQYSQLEVNRGLPVTMLVKYFEQIGRDWRLRANIRDMVNFAEFNLLQPSWSNIPQCDVIFLRNVLIYFDQVGKKQVLQQLHRVMHKKSVLILGSAESTLNLDSSFVLRPIGRIHVYTQALR